MLTLGAYRVANALAAPILAALASAYTACGRRGRQKAGDHMGQATPQRRMKLGLVGALDEGGFNGKTPSWRDVQALAQAAEQVGFDSFWLADHFIIRFPERDESGQWEVFTFLSAVAAVTSRIQIGPLVACTSFRNPALLAKMADSLDEISDGRFVLGLGAGWHEPEYSAFGYPFDHKAARFEEALQIIVPLLREGHVDFHGQYYEATDCVLRPRGPSAGRIPIWIGARRPRMLEQTARYADDFNSVWHLDPARAKERYGEFEAACAAVGRDPASVEHSAGTLVRLLAPGEEPKPDEKVIAGSAEEVAAALRGFRDVGVQHLVVVVEPSDISGVERFARVIELLDQE
jgi:probable F420-dependent oxidoreductase